MPIGRKQKSLIMSFRRCLQHTRAMQPRFSVNKQAMAHSSSEKCLQHTRAMVSHFTSRVDEETGTGM